MRLNGKWTGETENRFLNIGTQLIYNIEKRRRRIENLVSILFIVKKIENERRDKTVRQEKDTRVNNIAHKQLNKLFGGQDKT